MIKCPKHPIAYRYKKPLTDEKAIICCDFPGCNYESEPTDLHDDIPTFAEQRTEFNG